MCYMTTTTIVYTAPSSILPSIVSFSIPNAPIMSSATMFLSLLPPPQKSLLCQLVVLLMPPPLILLTLPPPSASKHATLAYQGPVASCPLAPLLPFASRLPAGCRIACCRVPPPRIIFRRAATSRVQKMATARCAVAIIVNFIVRCAVAIVVDVVVRRAVAIIVVDFVLRCRGRR